MLRIIFPKVLSNYITEQSRNYRVSLSVRSHFNIKLQYQRTGKYYVFYLRIFILYLYKTRKNTDLRIIEGKRQIRYNAHQITIQPLAHRSILSSNSTEIPLVHFIISVWIQEIRTEHWVRCRRLNPIPQNC